MNTREREVMDALALAARRSLEWIESRDLACKEDCGNPTCRTNALRSSVAAYDALLAEGSASSEGAEAVGFVDEDGDRVLAWRHNGREIAVTFGETPSVMATDEQGKLWFASGDTHPQPAQGEHEQPALERYGIEWRGPHMPIALPMPDGYWTPWHIAEAALKQRTSERQTNAIENAFYEAQGDIFTADTPWGEVSAWIAARAEEQRASERRPIADEVVEHACIAFHWHDSGPIPWPSDNHEYNENQRERMRAALESAHPRGLPAGSDAIDLCYCEVHKLVLHPNQYYIFTPDETCESCMRLVREHDEGMAQVGYPPTTTFKPHAQRATAEQPSGSDLTVARERIYAVRTQIEAHRGSFGDEWDGYFAELVDDLSAAISALATAEQPSCGQDARDAWQPIETAPHTGISVLLWQPWKSSRNCQTIGYYANGWVDRFHEDLQPEPTHWMPLPEPPDAIAAQQRQGGAS